MKKRLLSVLAALSMLLSVFPAAFAATEADSGLTAMPKLSAEEITRLLAENPVTMPSEESEIFDVMPSVSAPYAAGRVKTEVLQLALGRLNALRAIAGLPAVKLDSALCEQAQYGAVLIAASEFSHTPKKPADMDESFYKTGYAATSSSNLSAGSTLVGAVDSFMDDSDSSNIDRVGHRRWQLNPTMGKVGFGYALGGGVYRRYTAEKVFDTSGAGGDYTFIAWPASGSFPAALFDGDQAWSVTVDPKKYASPAQSQLTVTLRSESDGRTWTFSGGKSYSAGGGDYFHVDNAGYGVSNCIIFRPDGVADYSGAWSVTIDGLKTTGGQSASLSYRVSFFAPGETPAPTPTPTPTPTVGQTSGLVRGVYNQTIGSGVAVRADGTLLGWGEGVSYCWGKEWNGVPVELDRDVVAVCGSVGDCTYLKKDGTLWYTGSIFGEFGITADRESRRVKLAEDVVQFNLGMYVKSDGSAWELISSYGDEKQAGVKAERVMDGVKQVGGSIYSGRSFLLKNDGTLWSKGQPSGKGLGRTGSAEELQTFGKVLDNVAYVTDMGAVRTDGTLWCWGENYFGSVGNGSAESTLPSQVLEHVVAAWKNEDMLRGASFALTEDGALWSWGSNFAGELGFAGGNRSRQEGFSEATAYNIYYQDVPRRLDMTGVVDVCTDSRTTFVLMNDGSVWAAGSNYRDARCLLGGDDNNPSGFNKIMDGVMLPAGVAGTAPDTTGGNTPGNTPGSTPASGTAYASTQNVDLDGRSVEFQCYALKDENGNATNYIKLRDLAILLNGTGAQFAVGWDGSINIRTHAVYTPNGSELSTPFSGDRAYQVGTAVTKVDGVAAELAAITLTDDAGGGYTYYKLRDLGKALNFNVGWSAARGMFVETDKPYTDAD